MAKKKPKLTPLPKPAGPKPQKKTDAAEAETSTGPDLSNISEDLRPLAVIIGDLQFHPKNPRIHGEKDLSAIKASLRVNGQYRPILASTRTDPPVIVCGNGTLQAALSLGWQWIACSKRKLTEAQENQIAITDNATAELSSWDDVLLREMMEDMDMACDPRLDEMMAELAAVEGIVPKDDKVADNDALQHKIVIDCRDEAHQAELLERFEQEGLECKALMV